MFSTIVAKINHGSKFKEGNKEQIRIMSRKKQKESMTVNVETIKTQKVDIKRALVKVLKKIPKNGYRIKLKCMLKII